MSEDMPVWRRGPNTASPELEHVAELIREFMAVGHTFVMLPWTIFSAAPLVLTVKRAFVVRDGYTYTWKVATRDGMWVSGPETPVEHEPGPGA